jgi:hypothetical protein
VRGRSQTLPISFYNKSSCYLPVSQAISPPTGAEGHRPYKGGTFSCAPLFKGGKEGAGCKDLVGSNLGYNPLPGSAWERRFGGRASKVATWVIPSLGYPLPGSAWERRFGGRASQSCNFPLVPLVSRLCLGTPFWRQSLKSCNLGYKNIIITQIATYK